MKLHLPKSLFVAVMAACSLGSVSQAENTWGNNNGKPGEYYYFDQATFREIDATNKGNRVNLVADKASFSSSASITVKKDSTLAVCRNPWEPYHVFNHLLLTQVDVVDNGSIALEVKDGVTTTINKVVGALSSVTVSNDSKLILGTSAVGETQASTTTFSGTITNSGSLTLKGDIVVTENAVLSTGYAYTGKYTTDDGATESTNGFAMYDGTCALIVQGRGATVEADTITYKGQKDTDLKHIAVSGCWGVYEGGESGVDKSIYGVMESETLQSSTASTYILADTATLTFEDSMPHGTTSTTVTKLNVVGAGTVSINTLGDNHNSAVDLGEDFTGTLRITGGNMQLSSFKLHDDVKLELVSGQSWSDVTINREVLLDAEDIDTSYDFAYSTVTINGKVTGNYLQMTSQNNGGGTLTLNHAENDIDAIKLKARTLNLNGGKVGTIYVEGGTANIASKASVSTIAQTGGTVNINGAEIDHSGVLSASGGRINMSSGSITLSDKTQVHTISSTVDMAGTSGTYTGNLNLGAGVKVTATDAANFWLGGTAAVNLAKDAEFTRGDITVVGTGSTSKITRSVTDKNNNDYSSASTTHKISNAVVKNTTAGTQDTPKAVTYANIMDNVGVVNEGTNSTLTLTNKANKLNSVDAAKGDITLQNTSAQTLSTLAIAAGKSIGVYTGTDTANVGTLTVSGTGSTATFGVEASLNSNLVLGTGAELTLSGVLTLGGTLTLSEGLTLNYGAAVTAIATLAEEANQVVLFTGVGKLYLGSNTEASGILTSADKVDISTYLTSDAFKSSETGDYYLGYDGSDVYVEFVAKADEPEEDPSTPEGGGNVPEPTTGALSLLGLAALAMRRRRRA